MSKVLARQDSPKLSKLSSITLLLILTLLCLTLTSVANAVRYKTDIDVVVMAIFGDTVILTVDGNKHKLKVGDKTPEGIKLVAVDSDEVILRINKKNSSHSLGSQTSFDNTKTLTPKNKKNATAKIWPQNDMYVTQGSINNFSVQFMVDTGATWVAMSEVVAKRLGINYYRGRKGYAGTASGVAAIYKVTLDKVKVGGIELRNVPAAVISGYGSHQVLLGNSFLKRCEMTRTKSVMILKKKY